MGKALIAQAMRSTHSATRSWYVPQMGKYLVVLVWVGCASPQNDSIAVEQNALGVERVEIERSAPGGEHLLEIRGLAGDGSELAHLALRTGTVYYGERNAATHELPALGTELYISVGDTNVTLVTPDLYPHPYAGTFEGADTFVHLHAVAAELVREAGISMPVEEAPDETAYATFAVTCPASYMKTTPLAKSCCYDPASSAGGSTFHISPTNLIYTRARNPHGTGCKASDGTSSCVGDACFFGPCGFASPFQINGTGTPKVYKDPNPISGWPGGSTCTARYTSYNPGPMQIVGDVTGTCATTLCGTTGNGAVWAY